MHKTTQSPMKMTWDRPIPRLNTIPFLKPDLAMLDIDARLFGPGVNAMVTIYNKKLNQFMNIIIEETIKMCYTLKP